MKVLLDEHMPHKLRRHLGKHQVATVEYMGWSGLQNGDLLSAAESNGFEVLVTGDKGLKYQQNMTRRRIALVVLSVHNWPIIKHKLEEIAVVVDKAIPSSFQAVDCGAFRKGQRLR